MLTPTQHRILITLAVFTFLLAAINGFLFRGNRALQSEIATRGQYIQQGLQLEPVYQGLVRALAEFAAKENDTQLGQLLGDQGISFTVPAAAAAPAALGD